MDELVKLHNMLEGMLDEVKDNLGGEKIQPYVAILEGVLNGISKDINSEEQ